MPIATNTHLLPTVDVTLTTVKTANRATQPRIYPLAKRTIDISVALTMLVLLSPVLAVVALCIWLTDFGTVIFRQTRVGKDGKEFTFYKFRSMVINADALKDKLLELNQHSDDRTFKMKNDPRITWIGRFIRKTSIDELPQLVNILKGEMTLVGPRPAVPREVIQYTPYERHRLDVTPGLTCIWQVSGRSELPFPAQVELDLRYIREQSLWLDISLLFKTVPAVISGKGAY